MIKTKLQRFDHRQNNAEETTYTMKLSSTCTIDTSHKKSKHKIKVEFAVKTIGKKIQKVFIIGIILTTTGD